MSWKKLVTSGSRAELFDVSASGIYVSASSPMKFDGITTDASQYALVIASDGRIYKAASQFGTATLTLNNGYIYVGNGSNQATGVPVSGDISISNVGVFTIVSGSITSASLKSSFINDFTSKASLTGNDQFMIGDSAASNALKKITYDILSASLASTGFGNVRDSGVASVDNAIAIFNGTSGKVIKNSPVVINSNGDISGSRNFQTSGDVTLGDTSTDTVTVHGTSTFKGNQVTTTFEGSGSVAGDLLVGGNLTVNGDITTLNTQNLNVEDRFVLFASGSNSVGDGGIVIQQATQGRGIAFGYDSATGRFGLTGSLDSTATAFTPDSLVGMVESSTSNPSNAPLYGGSGNGQGTMHVNTAEGTIWVYVP